MKQTVHSIGRWNGRFVLYNLWWGSDGGGGDGVEVVDG